MFFDLIGIVIAAYGAARKGVGMARREDRFWSSTRGQLLNLLRQGTETVNELAAALGLTDNAVRAHLTALERDGLVRPSGTRRGPRKPTVTYALSAEADRLFPKEYGPLLRHLLDVLRDRLTADEIEAVARATGHRMAQSFPTVAATATTDDQTERAATVLRQLGGCCEPVVANGTVTIGCTACPLAIAAEGHPEVCQLVETLLTDVLRTSVRQRCQTDPLRCRFEFDPKT
jgi:predicted ArsR family transcriptional regulator